MDTARQGALEQAGQLFQGYFERRTGRLRFYAVLLDTASHRVLRTFDAAADPGNVLSVADTFAGQLGDRLRPFSTRNPDAIRAWGQSLTAADVNTRIAALQRATEADPNFGAPYVDLARMFHAMHRAGEAAAVLERARPHFAAFGDVDRARIQLADAEIKGDPKEQRQALATLSSLFTADVDTLRRLAELDLAQRDFNSAAAFYRKAAELRPDDPALLNALGYAEAYRGNLDSARAALDRYQALQPDQWNPFDSLGEVHFFLGRFEQAEKYFREAQKLATGPVGALEIVKAAQSRLMLGDLAGADAAFAQYIAAIGRNPGTQLMQAQWLYLTGRHSQAYDAIAQAAPAGTPVASYAAAQTAVWYSLDADRDRARVAAERCIQLAGNAPLGFICRSIVDPQAPVPEPLKQIATVYRPLLVRDFRAALPGLKALYERSRPGADAGAKALYAWALVETGRVSDAAPLVDLYPIPIGGGDLMFAGLEFPRYLAVRAAVRRSQGKTAEADSAQSLFKKLSGS